MKTKKLKLRGYVFPTVCMLLVSLIVYSSYKIWDVIDEQAKEFQSDIYINTNYSNKEKILPTVSEPIVFIKPFDDERVSVKIPFYNISDDEKRQQDALIYYENIYIPSTGIMYTSNEVFNVKAVYDGKVKEIKEDPIMGSIVEIINSDSITTVYQSLSDVSVKVNDNITQGKMIGLSSKNKIVDDYSLNFQVYKNGKLINPEEIYGKTIDELNE